MGDSPFGPHALRFKDSVNGRGRTVLASERQSDALDQAMARTIKRLTGPERSESAFQYAMLAIFLSGMIGFTLYTMSGALWNFVALAPIE